MKDNNYIEELSCAVHRAYCKQYLKREGKQYWTGGDYSMLDEETKDIDRATVKAVLAKQKEIFLSSRAKEGQVETCGATIV